MANNLFWNKSVAAKCKVFTLVKKQRHIALGCSACFGVYFLDYVKKESLSFLWKLIICMYIYA